MNNIFTRTLKTFLTFSFILLSFWAAGQSSGDYRSAASGNWSSLSSWQRYNGSAWVTPTTGQGYPGQSASPNSVTIQSPNTITVDVAPANSIGQTAFTVNAGGSLIVNNNIVITNKGAVVVNGTIQFNSTAVISGGGGGANAVPFTLNSAATLKTAHASGITTSGATGSVQVNSTRTYNSGANYEFNGTAQSFAGLPATVNSLTLSGSGTKTFAAAKAITGDFSIAAGVIANFATFTHNAGTLSLGGSGTATGSFGSTGSAATNKNNTFFTAGTTGLVTVSTGTCTNPTISLATIADISFDATSFSIPYSGATGSPTQYTISGSGITTVTNGTLPASPITVNLSTPAAPGSISFTLTVKNDITGCISSNINGSVTVLASKTYTTTGNFTTPAGVTKIKVECWGGGGKGGALTANGYGGGGGGGSYAAGAVAVIPASVYGFTVGAGSTTTSAGGNTYFINTTTVNAVGGNSVADNDPAAASGGAGSSGTGTVLYSGGGGAGGSASYGGGGGGSSAGNVSAGNTPTGFIGGTAVAGGGQGGNGRPIGSSGIGAAGAAPGGGGGGAYRSGGLPGYVGGNGANGQIIISVSNFSLTGTSGSGSICSGSSATINLTSTATGLPTGTYTVLYSLSGANTLSGASATMTVSTAGTGSFSAEGFLNGGATTVTIDNLSTAEVGNNIIANNTVVVTAAVNTWTGGSGNWSTPGNWTCGTVPASSSTIIISSGNPTMDVDFTLSGNLTISGTGALTIAEAKTLTIASGGLADFGGNSVTVKSSAAGTGAIGEISGTLSNATNVTVERYIGTAKRAWRILTIPVTGGLTIRDAWAGGTVATTAAPEPGVIPGDGTLITGNVGTNSPEALQTLGFDYFSGLTSASTSNIRYYDPVTNAWPSVNTPSPLLPAAKQGYMLFVRGDRTVTFSNPANTTTLRPTGTLNQGGQSVSLASTDVNTLVGNPYAASVDLDKIYNHNSSLIQPKFYVWDVTLGTSGAYRTLVGDGFGNYLPADIPYLTVNSGQAFFVVNNNNAGTLSINESDKTTTAPQTMFRQMGSGSTVSNISIQLYLATGATAGVLADGTMARYNNIYHVAATEPYDAGKLANFNENISLLRDGRYLSAESRPYPTTPDTLFVPAWNLRVRDYILSVTSNNFAGLGQTAILIDQFTNTKKVIDMNDAVTQYPFTITSNPASSSQSRFMIVLVPTAGGPLPVHFTKISAAPLNTGKVQVSWITASELGVKGYDVEKSADGNSFVKAGSVEANNANNGAAYQWIDDSPVKGHNYYRIRSNDESGSYGYSATAVVDFNGKKGIVVTPTVITNRQFTLSLNDMAAGNYKLILTDAAGRMVYQQVIEHAGGYNSRQVNMGKTFLAAGLYNLSVGDAKGNIQNFRLVVN